jgi:hypothetical protein
MPAPSSATYSVAALVAAQTSFKTLMDAATGPGSVQIRSSADVLLAEIALTDPCGTVNGTTGQLTLTPDGREESAPATGTAAYAEIRDGDGDVKLSMPCAAGTSPVAGQCVITSLSIVAGTPVEVPSITIG